MQTYLETEQDLPTLLEQANQDGEVRIQRKAGRIFVLKPEDATRSPLDVPGVNLGISTTEIIEAIHEGHRQF